MFRIALYFGYVLQFIKKIRNVPTKKFEQFLRFLNQAYIIKFKSALMDFANLKIIFRASQIQLSQY